jgi:two-component system, cell cycle sensor histidine kinase and response regulator CckA
MHKCALLVEDDADLRCFIAMLLHRSGWRVLEDGSANDAIARSHQHVGAITLLVTDVELPDMNGTEMARTIWAMRPEIKVLFLSGTAPQGMLPGAAFLGKPFSPADLNRKIRDFFEGETALA